LSAVQVSQARLVWSLAEEEQELMNTPTTAEAEAAEAEAAEAAPKMSPRASAVDAAATAVGPGDSNKLSAPSPEPTLQPFKPAPAQSHRRSPSLKVGKPSARMPDEPTRLKRIFNKAQKYLAGMSPLEVRGTDTSFSTHRQLHHSCARSEVLNLPCAARCRPARTCVRSVDGGRARLMLQLPW
jgi:hypothetical protein